MSCFHKLYLFEKTQFNYHKEYIRNNDTYLYKAFFNINVLKHNTYGPFVANPHIIIHF